MSSDKVLDILLVEDNPADVELIKITLKKSKVRHTLDVLKNGKDALKYLNTEGEFADKARPDLILLDLNLPMVDGFHILEMIKSDDNLKSLPVVILTSSEEENDIMKSYRMHANSFVTKPVGIDPFMEIVENLYSFWLEKTKLPPENGVR